MTEKLEKIARIIELSNVRHGVDELDLEGTLTDAEAIMALFTPASAVNVEAVEDLQDKIDGLEADLTSAINVAFSRGATEFVRLNYPKQYELLSSALTPPQSGKEGGAETPAEQTPAPSTDVRGDHPAGCVEEYYEGDEVAYLRDKLKQANERDRFHGGRITSEMVLREWFGGDRYARDHEYLDANFGKQAQQVVSWLLALAPAPQEKPNNETRRTFTVPEGHYAVRDKDDRATGEVRSLPSPQPREVDTLLNSDKDGGGEE